MPDAVMSLIKLSETSKSQLKHFTDFNVNAMSFTPSDLAIAIKQRIPEFKMKYKIDPLLQTIADSWPNSLDDSFARLEWGWKPKFDLHTMVDDMIYHLNKKLYEDKIKTKK